MDVLYLREEEVERLLPMEAALEAVEEAFRAAAAGRVANHARRRLHPSGGAYLHYMAAADETTGYLGLKLYTSAPVHGEPVQGEPAGVRFLVPLYRADTGALVALLEADALGRLRTGAASGVATKYMARPDASRAAILGSGHQAPTQLEALARVRRLERVRVYSPNPDRRRAFAEKMSAKLGLRVEPVESGEDAVREAEIVVVCTNAKQPALRGAWLAPGVHVNAVGANFPQKRELDDEVVARAGRIVVDSLEQSREEAGDLIAPFASQPERWAEVRELSQVVAGKFPGRGAPEEITLFKSNGVALEDVAAAVRVYERARAEGAGRTIRMWE